MADRTSAALFASLFGYLAKKPDTRAKEIARELYKWTRSYDFDRCQMECDDALRALGIKVPKCTDDE